MAALTRLQERQLAYNRRRELAFMEESKKLDREYNQQLEILYKRTSQRIQDEITREYLKYATAEGLSIDEAMKKISKFDVEAFAEKAAEYVKNKDFSPKANAELKKYNLKMRVSRLEYLQRQGELELLRLGSQEEAMLEEHLQEAHMRELNKQAGILGLDKRIYKRMQNRAKEIIYGDFQGAPFSARLWLNNREMIGRIRVGLERSILAGVHPTVWAGKLKDVLKDTMEPGKGNALYNAERLAVTETARVQIETSVRTFRELGYKKYIWIADPDERTCPECEALDNQVFEIDDSILGVETPPLHPWCRCSISPYYDEPIEGSWWTEVEE